MTAKAAGGYTKRPEVTVVVGHDRRRKKSRGREQRGGPGSARRSRLARTGRSPYASASVGTAPASTPTERLAPSVGAIDDPHVARRHAVGLADKRGLFAA